MSDTPSGFTIQQLNDNLRRIEEQVMVPSGKEGQPVSCTSLEPTGLLRQVQAGLITETDTPVRSYIDAAVGF